MEKTVHCLVMQNEVDSYYFSILGDEFRKRKNKNSSFSIRAFALFLKVDSGSLSAILKGKRKPTAAQARSICLRLALSPADSRKFLTSLKIQNGLKKLVRVQAGKVRTFELSTADQQLVLGWEHYAILCLMDTVGFESSREWIAQRLGIRAEVAGRALHRLEEMGLIGSAREGNLEKKFAGNFSFTKVTEEQQMKSALETVDLVADALKSMPQFPTDSFFFSSATMPVDPEKLKEVRELVTEFQLKLAALAEGTQPREVYRLAFGLFPLSH